MSTTSTRRTAAREALALRIRFCAVVHLYQTGRGIALPTALAEIHKEHPKVTSPFRTIKAHRRFLEEHRGKVGHEIEEIVSAWRKSSDDAPFTIEGVVQGIGISHQDDEIVHERVISREEREFIARTEKAILADPVLNRRAARRYAKAMYLQQAHQ